MSDDRAAPILRVPNLSRLEVVELRTACGATHVTEEVKPIGEGSHGELATLVAVVALTAGSIQAIAAWLLKTRRQSSMEQELVMVYPDGRTMAYRMRMQQKSDETTPADVLAELNKAFQLDKYLQN